MCGTGQVQLQPSLSQRVIPKNIQPGSLLEGHLADEVDLITAGNEHINITDDELVLCSIVFIYLFTQEQKRRGRVEGNYQCAHSHEWNLTKNGKAITVLIWPYFRQDSKTCFA